MIGRQNDTRRQQAGQPRIDLERLHIGSPFPPRDAFIRGEVGGTTAQGHRHRWSTGRQLYVTSRWAIDDEVAPVDTRRCWHVDPRKIAGRISSPRKTIAAEGRNRQLGEIRLGDGDRPQHDLHVEEGIVRRLVDERSEPRRRADGFSCRAGHEQGQADAAAAEPVPPASKAGRTRKNAADVSETSSNACATEIDAGQDRNTRKIGRARLLKPGGSRRPLVVAP